jgi:hypothetical protein
MIGLIRGYQRQEREQGQTAHKDGIGNTSPEARRVHAESEEGSEGVTAAPTGEVASQTALARQSGGCTAKRIRSGSPEGA